MVTLVFFFTIALALGWFWRVARIEVLGASSPAAIVEASGLQLGDNILLAGRGGASKRIAKLDWVASANVDIGFPAKLVIQVVQRVGVARISSDLVVDSRGFVFPGAAELVLPELRNHEIRNPKSGSVAPTRTKTILEALPKFPPTFQIQWIQVGPEVIVQLTGGPQILFGEPDQLNEKAFAARQVIEFALQKGENLALIDVKIASVPVSRPRATAAPAPTSR